MTLAQTLHRQRDPRVRRSMARWLVLSAVLVAAMLGIVGAKVQQTRLAYQLGILRATTRQLEELRHQLRVELATLRSPQRLESQARALGMVAPAHDQVRPAREYVAAGAGVAAAQIAQGRRSDEVGVR